MSAEEVFGNFFKSEVKSSGSRLFVQEKVSISNGSDTAVHAYVRTSPPSKVDLTAPDISSETIIAMCSCPAAKKDRLCKHIWATLLGAELKYPDFLSSKRGIELAESKASSAEETPESQTPFKASAQLRAGEYRKAQYQKQKIRVKELKELKRKSSGSPAGRRELSLNRNTFSPEIDGALNYFSENGFPMAEGPSEAILGEAKRKLSRVFHPDKGGNHEEIVELNKNWELLMEFLQR